MAFTLQANKKTTISGDFNAGATSLTLASAAFTNFTDGYLVVDYDNDSKFEIIKCTVSGTSATSITRAQDGTSDVNHSSGAKIGFMFVPSHYSSLLDGTAGFNFDKIRLTKGSSQSINTSTATKITFDTETYDTNGLHDNASNTRITIQKTGTYIVYAKVGWQENTTGFRQALFYKNGSDLAITSNDVTASGSTGMNVMNVLYDVMNLTAGDYLELSVFQNSGGALTVEASRTYFGATLIA